jgi:Amt family ammonium transporter
MARRGALIKTFLFRSKENVMSNRRKQVLLSEKRITFSEKLFRLRARLRDPEWRKYGRLLFAGKFLGIALVLGLMIGVPTLLRELPNMLCGTAQAQDTKPADTTPADTAAPPAGTTTETPATPPDPYDAVKARDIVNPVNTLWVLLAAFLVFGMQVGFTMLEAGFCRSRETVNVLMECIIDTCLCGVLFYAWGFAFMFGHGNGFIGWGDGNPGNNWFFLQNAPATYEGTGIAFLGFWLFQFAFADCASTICSGAMIGRTSFLGDLIYSLGVSGFIYPIVGHWAWGPDGFLATMGSTDPGGAWRFLPDLGTGFHDFAGSTVVHTIGGTIALAGAIALGPRLGRKFKRDGGGPMFPHDLTIAAIGGLILWFGWYGFNPGSTLSIMDMAGAGRVAANTTLAACSAGLVAAAFGYARSKKWDVSYTINGFLAGLVAITCPCYWVSPLGSLALGAVAGVVVLLGTDLLEYLRIDDPVGAVPVHCICGIWGTWSLGLFATGEFNSSGPITGATEGGLKGLFYGGGMQLLEAQVIGNAVILITTFVAAMVMFAILNAVGVLRVTKEVEQYGLDLHEHGISAYPEYLVSRSSAPGGMASENVGHMG